MDTDKTRVQAMNRALRMVACANAAPGTYEVEVLSEYARLAGVCGASADDLIYALQAGRREREFGGRGKDDHVLVWSKDKDFGSDEDWEAVTEYSMSLFSAGSD